MEEGRLRRWLDEIDELTRLYRDGFGTLEDEGLHWKPSPDVWSVGQILDHVIRANESYYPLIERARAEGYRPPLHGRFRPVPRFLGKLILRGVQPGTDRKMKTFSVWEPTASDVTGAIVDRFVRHHDELAAVVRDSADLIEEGVVIPSPASPLLVYELETAFDILLAHERRHLGQAERVLEQRRKA